VAARRRCSQHPAALSRQSVAAVLTVCRPLIYAQRAFLSSARPDLLLTVAGSRCQTGWAVGALFLARGFPTRLVAVQGANRSQGHERQGMVADHGRRTWCRAGWSPEPSFKGGDIGHPWV
jgi:hypothetical protein